MERKTDCGGVVVFYHKRGLVPHPDVNQGGFLLLNRARRPPLEALHLTWTGSPFPPLHYNVGMNDLLESIDRERLAELCRRHGIARLALFGSAARGELSPESDLDVLVEFIAGRRVGLRFITVQDELQELLGREVDLNTRGFLSPHFRDKVEAEAVPLYGE